jgi:hypothetical protein
MIIKICQELKKVSLVRFHSTDWLCFFMFQLYIYTGAPVFAAMVGTEAVLGDEEI